MKTCRRITEHVDNWSVKPTNYRVFSRDLLAVVCWIRPAVFCDEVVFNEDSWTKVPELLLWVRKITGVFIAAMVYKDSEWTVKGGNVGVLYLVNVDFLKKKCEQNLVEGLYPTYLFGTEAGVRIVEQKETLTHALVEAAVGILEKIESQPGEVLDLSGDRSVEDLLPMLNGWMLEYPVIYANENSTVELGGEEVAQSLNDRVVVRCYLPSTIVAPKPHKIAKGKTRQLFSFTISKGSMTSDKITEMIQQLRTQFWERRNVHQELWGPVSVEVDEPGTVVWAS